jgi:AcrR family transcriptional regulator
MPLARKPARRPNARIVERRRRDLIDATFSLIAEHGFEGLRTRDIAARAGVNVATLHYHFGTKEALLVALAGYLRDLFLAQQWRQAAAEDAQTSLRSHFTGAWRGLRANPRLATVLIELTLRAKRDVAARRALRSIHGYWNTLVEDILGRGIAAGQVRGDLDPRAGAFIATSFIMGAAIQLGVNPQSFDYDAVAREFERWVAATSLSSSGSRARGSRIPRAAPSPAGGRIAR